MALPANVSTGRVTGQFIFGVIDGTDPDQEPDSIPASGTITFTASVPYLPNATAWPNPVTLLQSSIVCVLDSEGYLCTPDPLNFPAPLYRGVRLIATDDPDLGVQGWTWNVSYKLDRVKGAQPEIPPHSLALLSGETRDLTTAVKVPSSQGIGVAQAEALAAAAVAAAQNAEALASQAVSQGVDAARDAAAEAGGARLEAIEARVAAESSAQAAQDAADMVDAPADTVMATTIGNESSQSRGALDSSFARVRAVAPGGSIAVAIGGAATAGGGTVRLLRGIHPVTTTLTLGSNITLEAEPGAVLDISGVAPDATAITATGTWDAPKALTADAAEGASSVTVTDITGITAGDYVKVSSNQVFGSTLQQRGEICRVASISGTTITLEDQLCDTYPVTADGRVEKMNPVENLTISGVSIVGGPDNTKGTVGMHISVARNVSITGFKSKNCHTAAVYLTDVIQSRVSDSHFTDSRRAGFGYGLAILFACQDITVTGCTGAKMRHLVTMGGGTGRRGIVRRVAVTNCTASQTDSSGFDCHPAGEFISFIGCHVIGSAQDGITMQGARFVISGCTIEGPATYGILMSNLTIRGLDGVVSNNVIHRAPQRGISFISDNTTAYQQWSGLVISGNQITDSGYGITVENSSAATQLEGLVISGNIVRRCTSSRIVILRGTQGAVMQGNSFHGPGGGLEALRLLSAPNTTMAGNHIDGAGTAGAGINLITSPGCLINGNQIRNGTGTGVAADTGSIDGIYGDNRNSYTTKEAISGTGWAKANNL